jgi:hypothetical protein
MSSRQSYTREISPEEIETMKRHIKAHGIDTAAGVDSFSYQYCMDIPNEKLLRFFRLSKAPRHASVLVDWDPQGQDATDPSSFRVLALECCVLNMLIE